MITHAFSILFIINCLFLQPKAMRTCLRRATIRGGREWGDKLAFFWIKHRNSKKEGTQVFAESEGKLNLLLQAAQLQAGVVQGLVGRKSGFYRTPLIRSYQMIFIEIDQITSYQLMIIELIRSYQLMFNLWKSSLICCIFVSNPVKVLFSPHTLCIKSWKGLIPSSHPGHPLLVQISAHLQLPSRVRPH